MTELDAWATLALTPHHYRICPTNKLLVEWQADLPGARWGFYRICDSPTDAKASLAALSGTTQTDDEQMELLDTQETT